jgi:hypothetical protein
MMMNRATHWLTAQTMKWWVNVLVIVLNFAAFGILFSLEDQFEALSGVPTFDTQNDLTAETLRLQLPAYTGEARNAYLRFSAFDFVFPLVGGIFSAVMWALLLRANNWPLAARLLRWNLPLLPFLSTLFDYGENISLLLILNNGASDSLVTAALTAKQLKLTMLVITASGSGVLLLFAMANWVYRFWRARTTAPRAAQKAT